MYGSSQIFDQFNSDTDILNYLNIVRHENLTAGSLKPGLISEKSRQNRVLEITTSNSVNVFVFNPTFQKNQQ